MSPVEIIAHAKLAARGFLPLKPWFLALCEVWPDFLTQAEFEAVIRASLWQPPPIQGAVHCQPVKAKETEDDQTYLIVSPALGAPFFALHRGKLTTAPKNATIHRLSYL